MTECAHCGEEIRPTADGDGIPVDDREYYAWVADGNPICITLTHEPKAVEPEPDVWVVILEDRHTDVDGWPFSTEEAAVAEARRVAAQNAHGECDIEEDELTPDMRGGGWVLSLKYCIEGDRVRVVKRTMDAGSDDD